MNFEEVFAFLKLCLEIPGRRREEIWRSEEGREGDLSRSAQGPGD